MIPTGWKLVGVTVLALGVLGMIGAGVSHYRGLLEKINTLSADKATLAASLETERATVESLKANSWRWKAAYEALTERYEAKARVAAEAAAEARRLDKLFGTHDLEALARARPGLVQGRINAGTARALRLLSCATTSGCVDADGARAADERAAASTGAGGAAATEVDGAP